MNIFCLRSHFGSRFLPFNMSTSSGSEASWDRRQKRRRSPSPAVGGSCGENQRPAVGGSGKRRRTHPAPRNRLFDRVADTAGPHNRCDPIPYFPCSYMWGVGGGSVKSMTYRRKSIEHLKGNLWNTCRTSLEQINGTSIVRRSII